MERKNEKIKIYNLYVTRQLGANAPLLFKIETVIAKSIDDARQLGKEKCDHYTAQSAGRYTYKCKVLQGGD